MQPSLARVVTAGAAAGIVAGIVAVVMGRRRTGVDDRELFQPDPQPSLALPAERRGSPAERGRADAYGLDLERLRGEQELEPVVEYLTYIQSKRGDSSHILFVRYDDLDTLAQREGEQVATFIERLDQLGVVVSNN